MRCVCASTHNQRGFDFSSALEADFGFSGKAACWVLGVNTAGSSWLKRGGAVSLFTSF